MCLGPRACPIDRQLFAGSSNFAARGAPGGVGTVLASGRKDREDAWSWEPSLFICEESGARLPPASMPLKLYAAASDYKTKKAPLTASDTDRG